MSQTSAYVLIIFLAFGGFLIARYIWHHKKNSQEALVCPLKTNCDTVIHSDFSKFLGIPIEIIGMIYYASLSVSYGFIIIFPALGQTIFVSFLLLASILAFIFSVYLTMVQAFVIKNWCTWCLISASICATIFVLDVVTSPLFSALFSNMILAV